MNHPSLFLETLRLLIRWEALRVLRLLAIPLILASVVGTGAAEDANDELFFDACIQSSSDRMRSLPPRLRSVYGFLVWTAIDEAAQACEDSNLSLGALVGKRLEDEGFYFTEGVEEDTTCAAVKLRLEASVRLRVNVHAEETGPEAFCIAASKAIGRQDIEFWLSIARHR